MKLGMSGAVFYGRMETEDEARHLTDFPLDVCEIFLETQSEYSASFGAQVLERLKGLPCVSVHPKGTQFEPDLFGRSRRQVEDAMRLFTGVCAAGEALHARYYVLHGRAEARWPRTSRKSTPCRSVWPRCAGSRRLTG
jgi:hypothetical protein